MAKVPDVSLEEREGWREQVEQNADKLRELGIYEKAKRWAGLKDSDS